MSNTETKIAMMDAIVKRELYTKYKTAPSAEEKEKARMERETAPSLLHGRVEIIIVDDIMVLW